MRYYLSVDIGGTDIKLGIVNADGDIEASGAIPTEPDKGPEEAAERIGRWFEGRGRTAGEASVAGVACAGLIDRVEGRIITSPNLGGWEGAALAEIFTSKLSRPVVVENDATAAAYGEFRMGSGRETGDFVCLTLGTGVGGGVVMGERLQRGWQGFAGEIGHTIIEIDGPLCSCGSRGCLEALVGAGAIVERAEKWLETDSGSALRDAVPLTVKAISAAASRGDELAAQVLRETGRYLGVGLSNIIHMLNPEVIAIGGGVAGAGEFLLEPARRTVARHVMHERLVGIRIVRAELGNEAALLGVALVAADESAME
jgi:glucokinase